MLDPVSASDFLGDLPDPELHAGRCAPWFAPVDGEPAHPQAGGGDWARLFVRDTHSVTPTADGEAMIEFARGILAANERAERYFAGSQLRGRLRFGASEDFVRRCCRKC